MDGLLRRHNVRLGIGDDAALLGEKSGFETVVSSDQFLEGVHFLEGKHPSVAVGYKALARAVSDLSAMGAESRAFLLNLALPVAKTGAWLDGFLAGLQRASRAAGIVLAGGDLSRNERVQISIVVIGRVRSGRAVLRSGARAGDRIYVSGKLGLAALGLRAMRRGVRGGRGDREAETLLRAHLYPPIRLRLGSWLARTCAASSMIDISDGFSMDLHRVCQASGVGARVEAGRVPKARVSEALAKRLGISSGAELEFALNGGDDYELLFTVPRSKARRLGRVVAGTRVTCVGEITRGQSVTLVREDGKESRLNAGGWDPFL
jgi:thiamine-monophosphate kinase